MAQQASPSFRQLLRLWRYVRLFTMLVSILFTIMTGSNAHCVIENFDMARYPSLKSGNAIAASIGETDNAATPLTPGGNAASDATLATSASGDDAVPRLYVVSAPEQAAIPRLASRYANYAAGIPKITTSQADVLANLAFTLEQRRSRFQWRAAVVASDPKGLSEAFNNAQNAVRAERAPSVLFVFTGQGAQHHAMGRELMQHKTFLRSVTAADSYLRRQLGAHWSVIDELLRPEPSSKVNLAEYSQPLCTILQIALLDMLKSWDIIPTTVIGHSSGEIGVLIPSKLKSKLTDRQLRLMLPVSYPPKMLGRSLTTEGGCLRA